MTTLPSQLPFPQAQLLLHELNHRIGNEFCCAISVVSLAAARSNNKEVKAALTDVAELLPGDAPDFVEVGEAGIAVGHAMRRQRRVQLVGQCTWTDEPQAQL